MKRIVLLLALLVYSVALFSQEKMYIHKSNHVTMGAWLSLTDSIYFSSEGYMFYAQVGSQLFSSTVANVDSISFGDDSNTISVYYNGTTAYVVNPLAFEGVSVTIDGADVTVNSTTETRDINYSLSGKTSDGTFKLYSEKRFNLLLNGVEITNPDGPALNIQSNNKASVTLTDGTTNTFTDGATYATAPNTPEGEEEGQDAAFFSEGKLVFSGSGSLIVNGVGADKHALSSDDLIQIDGGNITINSAAKDGIHGKDGVVVTSGTINVTASGDAIDGANGYVDISGGTITTTNTVADIKAIGCDSTLTISGGTIVINISGDQSKGLKSDQNMVLNGGNITINSFGGVVLESSGSGYNPSYCTAVKCDSILTVDGATLKIKSTGIAGRGISTDYDFIMKNGTVEVTTTGAGSTFTNSTGTTDAYTATCLSSDRNIQISNGSITLSGSGTGGKGISCDGTLTVGASNYNPIVTITTTGSKITISSSSGAGGGFGGGWGGGGGMDDGGTYSEAKAISCDGAVTFNSGTTTISSADDGIKSTTSVTINSGTVNITKAVEGIESPAITVNNGTVSIAASDDGFNATKGNGGESNDGSLLTLAGGTVNVNVTGGDGLDSNGSIAITGGTIVVNGPQSAPEVGMDYNGTCNVSGGLLIVTGPSSGNMIQATSTTSSQYAVKVTSSSIGTNLFCVKDASGNEIFTFKPVRSAYYMVFSSPKLANGSSYSLYSGGSSTGTSTNGLYSGGTYSGGTLKKTFSVSGKVTAVSF